MLGKTGAITRWVTSCLTGTPEGPGHPEVASLVKNFQRVLSQTRFLTLAEPDREMCLLPRVGDTVLRPAQLLFLI